MKTFFAIINISCCVIVAASEAKENVIRSLKVADVTYSYIRIDRTNETVWELRQAPSGEVIVKFLRDKPSVNSSIYTYSNLIDVVRDDNQVGALLSLDVGLLYVRCQRTNDGNWNELWRKIIIGATDPKAEVSSISLKQVDIIEVRRKDAPPNKFEVSKQCVKKDGVIFEPRKSLLIEGGNHEKSQ